MIKNKEPLKYIENQNRLVDDEAIIEQLENNLSKGPVLLIAPGKSSELEKEKVMQYIKEKNPIIIGVNAIHPDYCYKYLFFISTVRYNYAKEIYPQQFSEAKKILLSNIKTQPEEDELIVNYNRVIKRGWVHFDNAVIHILRLLDKLHVKTIALAGFDGFQHKYNESYADQSLPTLNPDNRWDELNEEISDMFQDFKASSAMYINFLTESIFDR